MSDKPTDEQVRTIKNRPEVCPTGWCDCLSCSYKRGDNCIYKIGEQELEKGLYVRLNLASEAQYIYGAKALRLAGYVKWDSKEVAEKLYQQRWYKGQPTWEQSLLKELFRNYADQLKGILTERSREC